MSDHGNQKGSGADPISSLMCTGLKDVQEAFAVVSAGSGLV